MGVGAAACQSAQRDAEDACLCFQLQNKKCHQDFKTSLNTFCFLPPLNKKRLESEELG